MAILSKKAIIEDGLIVKALQDIRKEIDLLTASSKKLQETRKQSDKEATGANAKKAIDLTKQLDTATKKLTSSKTEEAQTLAKLNQQKREQSELNKANAILNNKLSGTEEKLIASNKKLRIERKKLIETDKNYAKNLKRINSAIDKNNEKIRKNTDLLTKQKIGIGKYSTALKGLGRQLLGAAGVVGGMTALVGIVRNGVKIFKDFEKASSKLGAILDKTKKQISNLTEQAKRLGATTAFTASEVIALQIELAKLGFSTKEIEASTEGILNLAAATGHDLASSAELAGATLRIFNLDASEMGRVTDVLAKSTTLSSLSMEKLATIMPTVGKTAQLAGVSLEKTAALAGTLTDRGLDASSAATSLRNIFLELSKKGITWNEAMEKINNSTDKNKTSMDLFGKRAAAAGVILSETADSTDELTTSLEDSTGAANEMAKVMLNNLAGDMTKAQSAWEGFILSLEDGSGVISKVFRGIVQSGTGLLNMLTVLNTEYTNSATKAQEMNKAAEDTIPLWNFQIKTLELLIPKLKEVREESDRIANLRGKELKVLKKREPLIKGKIIEDEKEIETAEELAKRKRKEKKAREDHNKELLKEIKLQQNLTKLRDKRILDDEELDTSTVEAEVADQLEVAETLKANARAIELEEEEAHQQAINDIKQSFFEASLNFAKDIFTTHQDEKLAQIESEAEAEKQILQDQLDKGLISEQEFAQKSLELDKKTAIASAKAEKKKALFNIGINTAAAIVKALGSGFPPFNFINAGLVAAQGAIQAAFVAAKPIGFKDGVIGIDGKGTTKSDSIPAMLSKNESVITSEGTENAPLALDAINRGLLTDSNIASGMSKTQSDGFKASLLMTGNKLLEQLVTVSKNGVSQWESNGIRHTRHLDGSSVGKEMINNDDILVRKLIQILNDK